MIGKAIQDDVQPNYARGSALFTLKLDGGKRALLVRSDNSFTKEGEYWSAKSGKALPQGTSWDQKPTTEGGSQFIIQKGKKTRIRTWDAAENKWSYTRTGILWSTNKQIEVICAGAAIA